MQSKLITTAIMVVALSGCSESIQTATGSAKNLWDSTSGKTRDLLGLGEIDPAEQILSQHQAKFTSNLSEVDPYLDSARMRVEEQVPIEVKPLLIYSSELLQRLKSGWSGEKVGAAVRLVASSSVNAQVRANHTIFMPIGLFSPELNLTEDELAAVLAHELAHIIAGHNENDALVNTLNIYNKFNQLKTRRAFDKGQTLEQRYLAQTKDLDRESWVFNRLIVPNWTRKDESEADALGIDLLASAGFSPNAMASMLQKIASVGSQQASVLEAHLEQIQGLVALDATGIGFDKEAGIGMLKTFLSDSLGSQYDSFDERVAFARTYQKNHHPRRVAMRTENLARLRKNPDVRDAFAFIQLAEDAQVAFARGDLNKAHSLNEQALAGAYQYAPIARLTKGNIRLAEGNADGFFQNASLAVRSDMATLEQHERHLLYFYMNNPSKSWLQEAENSYANLAEAEELIPLLMMARAANGQSVKDLTIRCFASLDPDLASDCRALNNSLF